MGIPRESGCGGEEHDEPLATGAKVQGIAATFLAPGFGGGFEWTALGAQILENGKIVWAFQGVASDGSTIIMGAEAATEADAIAILSSPTAAELGANVAGPSGIYMFEAAGASAAGGGTGTAAGGGVLVTAGAVVGTVAVAVLATIAIDYAVHGDFFWQPVNQAGGFGIVLGFKPDPNASPSPTFVSVNCNTAQGLIVTQCKAALSNYVTAYYTYNPLNPQPVTNAFGYWTCGMMWQPGGGSGSLWNQELSKCGAMVDACMTLTQQACGPPPAAVPAPAPLQCVHCTQGQAPTCQQAALVGGQTVASGPAGPCQGPMPFSGPCPASGTGWIDAGPPENTDPNGTCPPR